MFNPFRRASRSVRFEETEKNAQESPRPTTLPSEEVTEAKQLVRRPSLARRLSGTLLSRRRASSSALRLQEEETSANIFLLTWGRNDTGQLLKDPRPEELPPHALAGRTFVGSQVSLVSLGLFHSLLSTKPNNSLYGSGDNDEGQLDAAVSNYELGAKPIRFQMDVVPSCISVGLKHSCLVTKDGLLLTWGCNESGQLGHSKLMGKIPPKQVDGQLRKERAIQVSCTENATLVLSEKGQVWSFGEATRGELGRPECVLEGMSLTPSPVLGILFCNPIAVLACGAAHVVCLTQTGRAIGWGWNKHGQLGYDSVKVEPSPVPLPFDQEGLRLVSCGAQHTAFLSENGRVFTAGSNEVNQLGREVDQVGFHMVDCSETIVKIACGAFHTLLLSESGIVSGFGANDEGQINPLPEGVVANDIFAGGDSSACLTGGKLFSLKMEKDKLYLDCATILTLAQEALISKSLAVLKGAILGEFHCTGLNRSFRSSQTTSKVDVAGIVRGFEAIFLAFKQNADGEKFMTARCLALFEELYLLAPQASEPDQLRCFFIALINPGNIHLPSKTYVMLIQACSSLNPASLNLILSWLFDDCSLDQVQQLVLNLFLRNAEFCVERRDWSKQNMCMPQTISLIQAMVQFKRLPLQSFYLRQPEVWPEPVLQDEWKIYKNNKGLDKQKYFSLFNYREIISAETKRYVLMFDSQNDQLYNAVTAAFFEASNPFLEISVRRECLVDDALLALKRCKPGDLIKPMKVSFQNEPGVDMGGVKKEFFELLSAALFQNDPFVYSEDGTTLWLDSEGTACAALRLVSSMLAKKRARNPNFRSEYFVVDSFTCHCGEPLLAVESLDSCVSCAVCGSTESPLHSHCKKCKFQVCAECYAEESPLKMELGIYHRLVLSGTFIGLAAYNSTLLDIHFPLCFYAGLMSIDTVATLEELERVDLPLARGLHFALVCSEEEFDSLGLDVPFADRNAFVTERIARKLTTGVQEAMMALRLGFSAVVDIKKSSALQLFCPAELEMMIIGVADLNFQGLKKNCKYEGGYSSDTPVVKWFWEWLETGTNAEEKHLLLSFATGSSHAPIGGLDKEKFLIQRAGPDSQSLPTAHTCFNTLLLPEYKSKKKLVEKLTVALKNAQGFGLQ